MIMTIDGPYKLGGCTLVHEMFADRGFFSVSRELFFATRTH